MPAPRSLAFLCVFLLAGGARALQWEVSDLSERPVVDAPLGLALDSGGRPSVAFVDEKRQRLLLARRIGGVWEEEEVFHPAGLGARAGEALDLAIDAHGRRHLAHASFRAYQGVQLEYLSDRRGTWQMETPGGPRRFGYDAAVALDPSGGAHLACRSARPDNDLYLVSPKGAGWEILDVETEGHVGFWIDLAMGGSYLPAATHPDNAPGSGAGRRYKPFIAHAVYDKSQEKGAGPPLAVHLRYIDPKGQWTTDVLPVSNAGYGLSLALSQWEEPHLTFGGGGRLYHAEKIATTTEGARAGWKLEIVVDESATTADITEDLAHAAQLVGWFASIALGPGNQPRIAFTSPRGLEVAHRGKDGWSVELVAAASGAGRWCKLACDAWGGVHVVYYDPTGRRARYAYGRP